MGVTSLACLATPCMHLQVGILTEGFELDQDSSEAKLFSRFCATILSPHPPGRHERFEFFSRGPITQRGSQVDSLEGVKAQIPHAIRR